jgi:hypothetical protein
MQVLLPADQQHHCQVDAEESPQLPWQKRSHEKREARRLRRVNVGVDLSHGDTFLSI